MAADLTKTDLQKLEGREWPAIKEAWLSFVPAFPKAGALPEHSSDDLLEAQGFAVSSNSPVRLQQISGIRSAALWEAVSLYQKAKHTNVAAKELLNRGLVTWSLFNFYHSGYLAAKGTMYLLGVTVPLINSRRYVLDLFAPPEKHKHGKRIAPDALTDFIAIPVAGLDQHQLWAWFQRLLRSTRTVPWDEERAKDLFFIAKSRAFVKQRNGLLYRPAFWISDDLLGPVRTPLAIPQTADFDPEEAYFLARLCDHAHSIFDSLLADLSSISVPIRQQVESALISLSATSLDWR